MSMSNNKPSFAEPATAAPDDLERESGAPREEENGTASAAAAAAAASNDTAVHEQQQQQQQVDGDADATIIAFSATSPRTSRRSNQFTMAQTPRHCNTNKARGGNNQININIKRANHQDDNDNKDDDGDGDKDGSVGKKAHEGEDKASTLIAKTKIMVGREEELSTAAAVTIPQASPPSVTKTNRAKVAGERAAAAAANHHQRHPSNNLESSLSLSLSSSSFSPTFNNTTANNGNLESGHHHQLQTTDESVLHDYDPRRSDPRRLLAHEHPLQQPKHPHTHHQFPHIPHHPPQRYHPAAAAAAAAAYPDDSNHAPVSSSLARYPPPPRHGAGASGRHYHPFHHHHQHHHHQQQQQQQQFRRVEHPHAASTTASSLSSRYYDQYPLPPPPPPTSYYHESLTSSAPSSRMHHRHQPPPPPGYYYNDHPRYYDPSPHPSHSHPPRDYYDYHYSATTDMDSHPPPPLSTSQLHQQSHHRNHHQHPQHQLNPNNYPSSLSLGDEDANRERDATNRHGGGQQQEQQHRHRGLSTLSEDGSKENTNCGGDDGNTSLHAVSSSFSNGTKDITNTMATTASTSTNSTTAILSLVANTAKHSPGMVTNQHHHHRTRGCSLEGTNEEYTILQQESSLSMMSSSMSLPNQPSLKSTNDGQHEMDHTTTNHDNNNDVESTSNSSWRILQQIASVDKDEMLRFQTSKSELTVATATSTSTEEEETGDVVNEADAKKKNSLAQSAGSATTTPKNKKVELARSEMVTATATTHSQDQGTLISSEREIDHNKAAGNITNNANNNKIIKQESPGEVLPATSNLSRTSSLSDSPAADDDNEDDNDVREESDIVDHENENCREVGVPSNSYPPRSGNTMHPPRSSLPHHHYPHHHYPHLPPHHQHHPPYHHYMPRAATMVSDSRSHHPPASLHPLRLSELEMFSGSDAGGLERGAAATNGDDEYSPSASTISTKASLVLAKTTHHHHHPAGKNNSVGVREDGAQGGATQQFVDNKHPPTLNMKPKHPVHVKKSREGGHSSADSNGNHHAFEASTSDQHIVAKRAKHADASTAIIIDSTTGNAPHPPPPPTPKEDSPTGALDGCVMANSLGDDDSPTAASATASSHHSQQSLELGAMPSWETAGKPLAGWSICSGMESLKEAVMGSAFSFSGTIEDESAMNNDDPSPKSILSKLGEKRRVSPGTHVQFSRDHSGSDNRLENTASSTPAAGGGGGGGSRKRNHGSVGWSQEPPPYSPRQLYDEYYYGEGPPPRHAHYNQYGDYHDTPHHPPPPSHRYPREHAFYPEEDPYYDHYYSPHPPPPPPPPYGYPPHPRHVIGRPTHRPEYPPYPTNSMPPQHSPAVMGGRNNLMVHTPPSTIHHPSLIHSQFSHNRAVTTVVGNGISFGTWTQEDDAALMELMKKVKSPENWDPIAKKLDRGKSPREIQERWTRFLKPGSRKGQWTEEEDAVVIEAVGNSVEDPFTRWSDLAQRLPGRVGKQVRDRWVNHLNPAISHLPFGREDDLLLWEGHNDVGKRWVEISCKYFKATRSENHIKNRWYSASFKKFIAKEFGPDAYRLANEIGGNGRNMASMTDSHHQPPLKEGAPIVSGYKVSAHNVMSS